MRHKQPSYLLDTITTIQGPASFHLIKYMSFFSCDQQ